MNNQDFLLDIVFRHLGSVPGEEVFTCSIPGDPTAGGYPYTHPDRVKEGNNNFFAVSTFIAPDGLPLRRIPGQFGALYCLVVDDVGTKVEVNGVRRALGSPTWVIETSPDNYQCGYRLSRPVTDIAEANGLIEALCDTFTPDVAGVNRLVRLPAGINGKPKYGGGYQVKLMSVKDVEISPEFVAYALHATPKDPLAASKPFLPAHEDPVIAAMTEKGHSFDPSRTPGTYDVQCPWFKDHTGMVDNGAAYIAPAGFKCHHGHCSKKTFRHFRDFLGLTAKQVDVAIQTAGVEVFVEFDTLEAAMSEAPPKSPALLKTASVKRFHLKGKVMSRGELQSHYPRQWLFKDLVTANGSFLIAGQGGLGKSRLALALAMSAAAGLPWGPFNPENTSGVRTMLLTQEDDDAEKGHRYTTQLRWMQEKDSRWAEPETLRRLEDNLFLPEIDPTEGLSEALTRALLIDQGIHGPYQFMTWDPLIMFWQGEDDQGLNSASGTRETLSKLAAITRTPAKEAGLPYSVCFVHHLNKAGTVLGSVMVENLVRTVFKLERDEVGYKIGDPRGTLRIDKANGIALRDAEVTMYLKTADAVVHFQGDFVTKSREQRVAELLVDGSVEWDQAPDKLLAAMERFLPILGDTLTERRALLKEVFESWEKGEDEALEKLGLHKIADGKKLRFRPFTGEE